jgi:hypothetical protein
MDQAEYPICYYAMLVTLLWAQVLQFRHVHTIVIELHDKYRKHIQATQTNSANKIQGIL